MIKKWRQEEEEVGIEGMGDSSGVFGVYATKYKTGASIWPEIQNWYYLETRKYGIFKFWLPR